MQINPKCASLVSFCISLFKASKAIFGCIHWDIILLAFSCCWFPLQIYRNQPFFKTKVSASVKVDIKWEIQKMKWVISANLGGGISHKKMLREISQRTNSSFMKTSYMYVLSWRFKLNDKNLGNVYKGIWWLDFLIIRCKALGIFQVSCSCKEYHDKKKDW